MIANKRHSALIKEIRRAAASFVASLVLSSSALCVHGGGQGPQSGEFGSHSSHGSDLSECVLLLCCVVLL